MAVNYVKFFRGTPNAFEKLAVKNSDTLYFISETDEATGSLYLGSTLISGNISSLKDLDDIAFNEIIEKNQILAYDDVSQKWVNKSVLDVVGLMIGATETAQGGNGLVPAPGMGQQGMFLRGDGVWAVPEGSSQVKTDNKTVYTLDDNQTISLKDFGVKYYKYISASGSVETGDYVEAHYEVQIVDSNNPWKAQLEPKVVEEDGELILGWFEPNPTTVEGIQDEILKLNNDISVIKDDVKAINDTIANDFYTKSETVDVIRQEITNVNHLTRKTFNSIAEAEAFIMLEEYPENYIYMILSSTDFWGENNKYDEYLYINGSLEKVGSWDTDLSDYATKEDLGKVETKVNNLEALLNGKADKTEVETVSNKVNSLEALLNNKADKTEVEAVNSKVTSLSDLVGNLNTKVNNLESFMNSDYFVSKEDYETDMNTLKEAVTWADL